MYRRIYSGFRSGRRICAVSLEAEAWFWRINAEADDFGNLVADPILLHRATAGLREIRASTIVSLVRELVAAGLLEEYRVGEEPYLHVVGWEDLQTAGNRNGKRTRLVPGPEDAELDSGKGGRVHPGESRCNQVPSLSGSGSDSPPTPSPAAPASGSGVESPGASPGGREEVRKKNRSQTGPAARKAGTPKRAAASKDLEILQRFRSNPKRRRPAAGKDPP